MYLCFYLRNRKQVPCFYRVIKTRVEVWENCRRVFPQLFPTVSIKKHGFKPISMCILFGLFSKVLCLTRDWSHNSSLQTSLKLTYVNILKCNLDSNSICVSSAVSILLAEDSWVTNHSCYVCVKWYTFWCSNTRIINSNVSCLDRVQQVSLLLMP